jgi:hypothetical protein
METIMKEVEQFVTMRVKGLLQGYNKKIASTFPETVSLEDLNLLLEEYCKSEEVKIPPIMVTPSSTKKPRAKKEVVGSEEKKKKVTGSSSSIKGSKCEHVFTRGKDKGTQCDSAVSTLDPEEKYCKKHIKVKPENKKEEEEKSPKLVISKEKKKVEKKETTLPTNNKKTTSTIPKVKAKITSKEENIPPPPEPPVVETFVNKHGNIQLKDFETPFIVQGAPGGAKVRGVQGKNGVVDPLGKEDILFLTSQGISYIAPELVNNDVEEKKEKDTDNVSSPTHSDGTANEEDLEEETEVDEDMNKVD